MAYVTTKALHTGYDPQVAQGAITPPLQLSTTFVFGNSGGYDYSRSNNPTRETLEQTLAALDGAAYALAYSSGSAVLANVLELLDQHEAVLFSTHAYGGTYRYISQVLSRRGGQYHTVDMTDLAAVAEALNQHRVKLVWIETPTNPLLDVADIAAIAELAHAHGAFLAVDNTFATPVLQLPLAHGADIVAYSTTKYMNGHSDSVGGSLATNNVELYERLKFLQNAIGAIMSPFDSWLTLRGLRTLELRMERHVRNARAVADLLKSSSKVKRVYYPAYFTGAQGKIVATQMAGPGGMVSVELKERYNTRAFIGALQYFPLAESLGAVESLIDHPASMTHAAIPKAERERIGITDGLLRISVGIEHEADLIADLEYALAQLR